jgi:hypothetical protein
MADYYQQALTCLAPNRLRADTYQNNKGLSVKTNEYEYLRTGCYEIEPDGTKSKLHADRFTRQPTRAQHMTEQYGAKLEQINDKKIASGKK